VVEAAVALRREHHAGVGVSTLEQEDVRLLTRLEDAELGVDGGVGGDDPVGPRLGAGEDADVVPGGPALAGGEVVGLDVAESVGVRGG